MLYMTNKYPVNTALDSQGV